MALVTEMSWSSIRSRVSLNAILSSLLVSVALIATIAGWSLEKRLAGSHVCTFIGRVSACYDTGQYQQFFGVIASLLRPLSRRLSIVASDEYLRSLSPQLDSLFLSSVSTSQLQKHSSQLFLLSSSVSLKQSLQSRHFIHLLLAQLTLSLCCSIDSSISTAASLSPHIPFQRCCHQKCSILPS
jgi:hypothetical protein